MRLCLSILAIALSWPSLSPAQSDDMYHSGNQSDGFNHPTNGRSVEFLEIEALRFFETIREYHSPSRQLSPSTVFTPEMAERVTGNDTASFLKNLKEQYPAFFLNWTAVTPSLSKHGGTKTHPRVFMVDDSSRTFITWTGAQRGQDKIEMMHLDASGTKPLWNFYEMDFSKQPPSWTNVTNECASCHSPDPQQPELAQPLWDTYKDWPRVIFGADSRKSVGMTYPEFEKFEVGAINDPRYGLLTFNLPVEQARADYPPDDQPTVEYLTRGLWRENHNRKMNEATQFSNLFRLDQAIRRHPDFEKLKYALWIAIEHATAELMEPPKPGNPSVVVEALGGKGSALGQDYLNRYERLMDRYRRDIRHAVYSNFSINGYRSFSNSTNADEPPDEMMAGLNQVEIDEPARKAAELGSLLEMMGIDLSQYSTHTARHAPLFGAHVRFKELSALLYDREKFSVPDFMEFTTQHPETEFWTTAFQPWIEKARTRIENFKPAPASTPRVLTGHELMVRSCASCHQEDEVAPRFPFADSAKFKVWLTPHRANRMLQRLTASDPDHRMPLNYPALHTDEIQTLQSYWNQLLLEKSQPPSDRCQVNPFADIEDIVWSQSLHDEIKDKE